MSETNQIPKSNGKKSTSFVFILFQLIQGIFFYFIITSGHTNGLTLFLITPVAFIVWLLFSSIFRKSNKKLFYFGSIIFFGMLLGTFFIINNQEKQRIRYAEEMVQQVLIYKKTHGKYPESIELTGYDKTELRKIKGVVYSKKDDGDDFYISVLQAYDLDPIRYDWTTSKWRYSGDGGDKN